MPYAQHLLGTAYIRNLVKVVMGQTTSYLVDSTAPIAQRLADAYPGLFTDRIPSDVAAYIRYPSDRFQVEAEALTWYHMTSPVPSAC